MSGPERRRVQGHRPVDQPGDCVNCERGTRDEFGQPGRRCSIPIDRFSTPTGGSYVGCMVAQGVSKDCIFNEDFRYVFKSAVGAVVYELR